MVNSCQHITQQKVYRSTWGTDISSFITTEACNGYEESKCQSTFKWDQEWKDWCWDY